MPFKKFVIGMSIEPFGKQTSAPRYLLMVSVEIAGAHKKFGVCISSREKHRSNIILASRQLFGSTSLGMLSRQAEIVAIPKSPLSVANSLALSKTTIRILSIFLTSPGISDSIKCTRKQNPTSVNFDTAFNPSSNKTSKSSCRNAISHAISG